MNKLTKLIPLILILSLAIVPFAYASESLYLSNPESNLLGYWNADGPQNETNGRTFTGDGNYLSKIIVYIQNSSTTMTGTIECEVWGNLTDHKPANNQTANETATSSFSLSSLTGAQLVTFEFSDTYKLESGSEYTFAVKTGSGLTNHYHVGYSASGGWTSDTNGDGGWSYFASGNQIIYYLYTETVSGGGGSTPAPSPTTTPAAGATADALIDTFVDYLIPLILFLLPALILGWLTRWQKWPILIGLAIGAGLTYLFLGADYLWLVILVVIGIGASAYQSSRGPG